jgi:hypothetical protein
MLAWTTTPHSEKQSRTAVVLVQAAPLAMCVLAAAWLSGGPTTTDSPSSAFSDLDLARKGLLASPGAAVAMLCVVAAAPVSHVSGAAQLKSEGFRLFQPGAGGSIFIFLQALGWTAYGAALLHWLLVAQRDSLAALGLLATTTLVLSVPAFDPNESRRVPMDSHASSVHRAPMAAGASLGVFGLIAVLMNRAPQPLSPGGEGWASLSVEGIHVFEGRQLQQDDAGEDHAYARPPGQDLHQQTMTAVSGVMLVIAGIAALGMLMKASELFKPRKTVPSVSDAGGGPRLISRLSEAAGRVLSGVFEVCAKASSRYPVRVVTLAWLLVVLMCVGFTQFKINDDLSIWIPTTSRVQAEYVAYDDLYAPLPRIQSMLIERDDGGNMLLPDVAAKVDRIVDRVLALQAESNGRSGAEMCVKVHSASSQCLIESPFLSVNRLQLLQAQAQASSSEVLTLQEDDVTLTQKPIIENLGGAALDDSGRIVSASSVYIEWIVAPGDLVEVEAAKSWEDRFDELDLQEKATAPELTVLRQSGSSYADGVNDAVLSSVPYYAFSAVVMQMYIVYEFGSKDCVRSRITLGFCGETAVLMSSISALGCYCLAGYQLTHMTVSGLFLLMGVGLDDMFVLLKTFEREDRGGKSTELRLIHSMKESVRNQITLHLVAKDSIRYSRIGEQIELIYRDRLRAAVGNDRIHAGQGASVTMTSLTNVVAFSIGSHLPFPALADFCCFLSLGVGFTFVFFLTFFIACMVLDQARVDAEQDDLVLRPLIWMRGRCCSKNAVKIANVKQSPEQQEEETCEGNASAQQAEDPEDTLLLAIQRYWAPAVLSTPLRRVFWAVFYGLTLSLAVFATTTHQIAVQRSLYGLEVRHRLKYSLSLSLYFLARHFTRQSL